jgi:hypothetical protein
VPARGHHIIYDDGDEVWADLGKCGGSVWEVLGSPLT